MGIPDQLGYPPIHNPEASLFHVVHAVVVYGSADTSLRGYMEELSVDEELLKAGLAVQIQRLHSLCGEGIESVCGIETRSATCRSSREMGEKRTGCENQ
jgi:hypothetical protein